MEDIADFAKDLNVLESSEETSVESPNMPAEISSTIAEIPHVSTEIRPSFRDIILNRLVENANRTQKFESIFTSYFEMCKQLLQMRKRMNSSSSVEFSGDGSNARVEALREELSEMYKKNTVIDKELENTKKLYSESQTQVRLLSSDNEALQATQKQLSQKIVSLEYELSDAKDQRQKIYDEWIAIRSENTMLGEKLLNAEQENCTLLGKIRQLQQAQVSGLNDELDRFQALKSLRIEKCIAAAIATTPSDEECELPNQHNFVSIGDVMPSKLSLKFTANNGEITDILYLKDDLVATSGSDKEINLWSIAPGGRIERRHRLTGCNQTVTRLDLCQEDTKFLLASSNDHTARIWNIENQRMITTLSGHSDKVNTARFYHANQAVTGSCDRSMRIWDLKRSQSIKSIFIGSSVLDIITHRAQVFSGHFDKKLRVWDGRMGEPVNVVAMEGRVTCICKTAEENQILVSSRDDTLSLLDIRTMQIVHIYAAEMYKTTSDMARCTVSPSMYYCAAGTSTGSVFVWNISTTQVEAAINKGGHNHGVLSLAWSPNGRGLLSGDKQSTVCLWE